MDSEITKCEGGKCPLKINCYRFIAPDNEIRQEYFIEPPYVLTNNTAICNKYWKIKDEN